jgi:hypothetical protein
LGVSGTTVYMGRVFGQVWNNTTAPIASLSVTAPSLGLDCGSKVLLYKKVNT